MTGFRISSISPKLRRLWGSDSNGAFSNDLPIAPLLQTIVIEKPQGLLENCHFQKPTALADPRNRLGSGSGAIGF